MSSPSDAHPYQKQRLKTKNLIIESEESEEDFLFGLSPTAMKSKILLENRNDKKIVSSSRISISQSTSQKTIAPIFNNAVLQGQSSLNFAGGSPTSCLSMSSSLSQFISRKPINKKYSQSVDRERENGDNMYNINKYCISPKSLSSQLGSIESQIKPSSYKKRILDLKRKDSSPQQFVPQDKSLNDFLHRSNVGLNISNAIVNIEKISRNNSLTKRSPATPNFNNDNQQQIIDGESQNKQEIPSFPKEGRHRISGSAPYLYVNSNLFNWPEEKRQKRKFNLDFQQINELRTKDEDKNANNNILSSDRTATPLTIPKVQSLASFNLPHSNFLSFVNNNFVDSLHKKQQSIQNNESQLQSRNDQDQSSKSKVLLSPCTPMTINNNFRPRIISQGFNKINLPSFSSSCSTPQNNLVKDQQQYNSFQSTLLPKPTPNQKYKISTKLNIKSTSRHFSLSHIKNALQRGGSINPDGTSSIWNLTAKNSTKDEDSKQYPLSHLLKQDSNNNNSSSFYPSKDESHLKYFKVMKQEITSKQKETSEFKRVDKEFEEIFGKRFQFNELIRMEDMVYNIKRLAILKYKREKNLLEGSKDVSDALDYLNMKNQISALLSQTRKIERLEGVADMIDSQINQENARINNIVSTILSNFNISLNLL